MDRSAEQIALDEKIARIRKQNEEIIRRKQVIDEEIQSAKRNNAVVNIKKTYNDEPSREPSMYSDSFVTNLQNTVSYPKMRVGQIGPKNRKQNKHEDVAWRREREEIDHERIRRQKAASGWRREWDADKTLDDQRQPVVEKNVRDVAFRSRGNDNQDESIFSQQGRRPRVDVNSNQDVKRDISLRLLRRKSQDNDDHGLECKATTAYRAQERNFHDSNSKWKKESSGQGRNVKKNAESEIRNESGPTEALRKENEIRKPLNRIEGNFTESGNRPASRLQTSGPLNLNKTIHNVVVNSDKPDMIINKPKVTKYSETKVQTLPENLSWKNDYSYRNRSEADRADDVSKRLENIVIRVKNNDEKKVRRVVELVNEPSTKEGETNTKNKTKSNETSFKTKFISFPEDSTPTFNFKGSTPRQSEVFSFGDASQSLGLKTNTKREVVIEDDNDDEWEDVSDGEWEDVSD